MQPKGSGHVGPLQSKGDHTACMLRGVFLRQRPASQGQVRRLSQGAGGRGVDLRSGDRVWTLMYRRNLLEELVWGTGIVPWEASMARCIFVLLGPGLGSLPLVQYLCLWESA
uniref:Uncharacterized protein n=1 Tax=Eutreptiella gymnastica TaxID=73025 RepID=A0A7S1I671_9EUGL